MSSIALIGSRGYVGGAMYQELARSQNSVTGVTRENHADLRGQNFDILINCAMPSGRFWVKNHPEEDFKETVQKTADLLYGWKHKKFIQISTVSARCQLDTVYGRHKAAAEALCNFGDNLVVRLGPLYGGEMKKGVLADMLEGKKVFMDKASRFSFISLSFCASWIASNLERVGIVELGGKNPITLDEVTRHMGVGVEFEGTVNNFEVGSTEELPEANQVLKFLDDLKNKSLVNNL